PLIGTAVCASFSPCFLSLARNSPALWFAHTSRCPSPDQSHAGRASSACCSTRWAFGNVLQRSVMDRFLRRLCIGFLCHIDTNARNSSIVLHYRAQPGESSLAG